MNKKKDFISFLEVPVPSTTFPEELWLLISQHADIETLQQLGLLNKQHQRINNTNFLWKPYLTAFVPTQTKDYRKTFMKHPEYVNQNALLSHPIHQFLLEIAQQEDQAKAAKELTEKACHSVAALRTLIYSKSLFQTITSLPDGALLLKKLFCKCFDKTINLFNDSIDYHEAVELMDENLDMKGACLLLLEELRLMQLPEEKYKVVRQFLSSKDLGSLFDFSPPLSEEQIVKMIRDSSEVKNNLLEAAHISWSHALSLLRTEASSDIIMSDIALLNPIVTKYVEAALFFVMSYGETRVNEVESFPVLQTICHVHGLEEMYQYLLENKNRIIDLNAISNIILKQILNRFMQGDIVHLSIKTEFCRTPLNLMV